jgi:hypothetical protein
VKNTVQIAGKRVSRVICTYLGLVVGGLVDGRYLEVAGTTRERDREREKKAGRKNNNKKKKDISVNSVTPQPSCGVALFTNS